MNQVNKKIQFFNGVNTDVAKEYLKDGQSDYRLNCDIVQTGSVGKIVNKNGNELISLTLPSGTNEVIGKQEDIESNAIIYFIYNSNANHCIVRYNITTNTFNKILWNRVDLRFGLSYPVLSDSPVNGNLFFVNGINENKCINIEKAIAFTEGTGTNEYSVTITKTGTDQIKAEFDNSLSEYKIGDRVVISDTETLYDRYFVVQNYDQEGVFLYFPFDYGTKYGKIKKTNAYISLSDGDYDLIRKPPVRRPIVTPYYNSNVSSNNLIGKLVKFCYRYVYDDFTYSVYSPVSQLVVPEYNTKCTGTNISQTGDNAIKIWLERGSDEVKYIELAFQSNDDDWKLAARLDRGVGYNHLEVNFYNNLNYSVIPNAEIQRSFDNIPLYSKDITIIPDTYIALSGNQMKSDDVTLSVSATTASALKKASKFNIQGAPVYTLYASYLDNVDWNGNDFKVIRTCNINFDSLVSNLSYGLTLNIVFSFGASSYAKGFVLPNITDSNQKKEYVKKCIASEFSDFGRIYQDSFVFNETVNDNKFNKWTVSLYVFSAPTNLFVPENAHESFRGLGKFGIVYYDKYRRNTGIKTNDNLLVNFPVRIDNAGDLGNLTTLSISHTPPVGSKYYQIFYTGNLAASGNFRCYSGIGSDNYGVNFIATTFPYASNAINGSYTYSEGDILKILAKITTPSGQTTITSITPITCKVIGQLNPTDITKVYIDLDMSILPSDAIYFVCEVLKRSSKSYNLFYECSPVLDIYEDDEGSLYHVGNLADQYTSGQASVILTKGDYYLMTIFSYATGGYSVSELSFESFYYKSSYWGNGRINIPTEQVEGGFLNNTLLSDRYIPNTQINGLSTFRWQESTNEVNEKYGEISKSELVGSVFHIIQKNKITTFGVGTTTMTLGDGSTQISAIDSVLGKGRELVGNYGTIFPESICKKDRTIYGYDIFNKCIFRNSANGTEDVSAQFGFSKIIKQISESLLSYNLSEVKQKCKVVSYIDSNGMVYFTFYDRINASNRLTISFYEPGNWMASFHSFIPEMYSGINEMYTFKNGALYKHSDDAVKCEYYGVKYPQVVKAVHNEGGIKIFDSFILNTNKRWDVSALIDPTDTYLNGMYTEIKAQQLKSKEGVFVSEFLRNMKSRQSTPNTLQLYSGDKMRGNVLEMTLQNEEDSEVWIESITINARDI